MKNKKNWISIGFLLSSISSPWLLSPTTEISQNTGDQFLNQSSPTQVRQTELIPQNEKSDCKTATVMTRDQFLELIKDKPESVVESVTRNFFRLESSEDFEIVIIQWNNYVLVPFKTADGSVQYIVFEIDEHSFQTYIKKRLNILHLYKQVLISTDGASDPKTTQIEYLTNRIISGLNQIQDCSQFKDEIIESLNQWTDESIVLFIKRSFHAFEEFSHYWTFLICILNSTLTNKIYFSLEKDTESISYVTDELKSESH